MASHWIRKGGWPSPSTATAVTRLEKNGALTVLADRHQGKRLNSPNDLVYKSDGALYFTDPPFGLPKVFDDPRKELAFSGVFRLRDGRLDLVSTDLEGPNGLAFSPDERYLYVTNWDTRRKVVMRYEVRAASGSLPLTARTSAPCGFPSWPQTWRGATTAGRRTRRHARGCIGPEPASAVPRLAQSFGDYGREPGTARPSGRAVSSFFSTQVVMDR